MEDVRSTVITSEVGPLLASKTNRLVHILLRVYRTSELVFSNCGIAWYDNQPAMIEVSVDYLMV